MLMYCSNCGDVYTIRSSGNFEEIHIPNNGVCNNPMCVGTKSKLKLAYICNDCGKAITHDDMPWTPNGKAFYCSQCNKAHQDTKPVTDIPAYDEDERWEHHQSIMKDISKLF